MPITNQQPIQVGTFDKMWISGLSLNNNGSGSLRIVFNPYDGQNILATNTVTKNYTNLNQLKEGDSAFESVIASLIAECKRQAGTSKGVVSVNFSAPSPSNQAFAIITFEKSESDLRAPNHIIKDCFALAQSDQQFGAVFQSALVAFSQKSGFTYQQ